MSTSSSRAAPRPAAPVSAAGPQARARVSGRPSHPAHRGPGCVTRQTAAALADFAAERGDPPPVTTHDYHVLALKWYARELGAALAVRAASAKWQAAEAARVSDKAGEAERALVAADKTAKRASEMAALAIRAKALRVVLMLAQATRWLLRSDARDERTFKFDSAAWAGLFFSGSASAAEEDGRAAVLAHDFKVRVAHDAAQRASKGDGGIPLLDIAATLAVETSLRGTARALASSLFQLPRRTVSMWLRR